MGVSLTPQTFQRSMDTVYSMARLDLPKFDLYRTRPITITVALVGPAYNNSPMHAAMHELFNHDSPSNGYIRIYTKNNDKLCLFNLLPRLHYFQ